MFWALFGLLVIVGQACNAPESTSDIPATSEPQPQGKLFIIGGGKRPPALIERLAQEAAVDGTEGYVMILPYSSAEPDSSYWYAKQQFLTLGIPTACAPLDSTQYGRPSFLDSLRHCPLIYLPGGDQNRFMQRIAGTGIAEALHAAYTESSVIAGTSAGAAVMSQAMITGNEKHYPDYNATFRNLEADNIELGEGLGFLTTVIIDQHFVKRSRYNRLFSAVMEHPELLGIGIDESTAVLVQGQQAEVVGSSQVILFRGPAEFTTQGDLIGARGITVDVLLPGETFSLKIQ
ncbi:MAG TPA: cyanophycinase [Cytophagales bacterium]|nr:cyanophycinase [Cytophagales bacterium]